MNQKCNENLVKLILEQYSEFLLEFSCKDVIT